MYNHEPQNYICPFCRLLRNEEGPRNSPQDIVYNNELVTAFISPRWWPKNVGYVLVVPNQHFENIYDLPLEYGHALHDAIREIAMAFKAVYHCDGVTTRQHNEPDGSQDVWHYHTHVFPRYKDDNFYQSTPHPEFLPSQKRVEYATMLRDYFRSSAM